MKKAFRSFKLAATFLAHLLSTGAPEHCTETHPLLLFLVFVISRGNGATSQHVSIQPLNAELMAVEWAAVSSQTNQQVAVLPNLLRCTRGQFGENKRDGEERSGCFSLRINCQIKTKTESECLKRSTCGTWRSQIPLCL